MKLSFRKRIALFNTMAVATTIALVFIVIYAVVYYTSYHHLDKDLRFEKNEVISNLFWKGDSIIINKMPEWEEAEHRQIEVNPTFIQIVDSKGQLVFRSANLQTNHFVFDPLINKENFYNSNISNQRIRLGQFPILSGNGKIIAQLTIGVSQQESYNVLNNLLITLCISFPIMLIVLYVVILMAASKGIAPVNELINTASQINDTNISTRLPMPPNEDEIYQLAATINELLDRIEGSIEQQKQFTADASHEMRTPLSGIRGILEVLLRRKRTPEQYEAKINEVIVQVDRLSQLFDQMLQLARLESGTSLGRKESISLYKAVTSITKKWEVELSKKQIQIHIYIAQDAIVPADVFFLGRMLENLVSNAIKYSHEKGHIFFNWNATNHSLTIKDNGHGIPGEHLPFLFNRFYRADNARSSQIQGNGLGLAIVKKLADLQQIKLLVSSSENEGTAFTLQFPS